MPAETASSTGVSFCKKLAANDKQTRDKAVKLLTTWLSKHPELTEKDFLKLWKGLFYCMWMSDKVPIQQELAEKLASLIHVVPEAAVQPWYSAFWITMIRDWDGIDRLRLDKFMSLVRYCVREALVWLRKQNWSEECVDQFNEILLASPLDVSKPHRGSGLSLHFADLFLSELSATSNTLEPPVLLRLLKPFLHALSFSSYRPLRERIQDKILKSLLMEPYDSLSDTRNITEEIFNIASDPSTPDEHRKMLYALHTTFEAHDKTRQPQQQEEKKKQKKKKQKSQDEVDVEMKDSKPSKKNKKNKEEQQKEEAKPSKKSKEEQQKEEAKPSKNDNKEDKTDKKKKQKQETDTTVATKKRKAANISESSNQVELESEEVPMLIEEPQIKLKVVKKRKTKTAETPSSITSVSTQEVSVTMEDTSVSAEAEPARGRSRTTESNDTPKKKKKKASASKEKVTAEVEQEEAIAETPTKKGNMISSTPAKTPSTFNMTASEKKRVKFVLKANKTKAFLKRTPVSKARERSAERRPPSAGVLKPAKPLPDLPSLESSGTPKRPKRGRKLIN